MIRSTAQKVRIPTVEEIESTATTDPVITKKSNFTRFRQPTSTTDSSSAKNAAGTSTPEDINPTNAAFRSTGGTSIFADKDGASNLGRDADTASNTETKSSTTTDATIGKRKSEESQNRPIIPASETAIEYATGSRAGGGSTVVVNPRQKGNPLLRFLRNVPYEFGQTPADYILGEACCALFLSLKFHRLHSDYVHERLKEVGHTYALQVLLVQVDIPEPEQALRELNTICFNANWTLMLAWSPEEAAELLESYKIYENKPPDFLMGRQETDPRARLVDLLTAIKSITRTDAENLIVTFGSVKNMVEATEEQLALCPGLGLKKAKRLFNAFGAAWSVGDDEATKDLVSFTVNEGEGTSSAGAHPVSDDIEMDDLFDAD